MSNNLCCEVARLMRMRLGSSLTRPAAGRQGFGSSLLARSFSSGVGVEKIAMVGSGNFGSALVRILGQNALRHPVFDNEVKMYVHEETFEGEPLTTLINKHNENVKYLPGAKFTPNVVAVPDISEAVKGATMVCFCLPHQFLKPIMPKIKVRAASCVSVQIACRHTYHRWLSVLS